MSGKKDIVARGIDVSANNGKIDWKKVKNSSVEFAIIRAGYGEELSQKDAYFEDNMRGALENGLDAGVYWFSYAVDPEAARREARVCMEVLKPWKGKFSYPVFYDFEYATEVYAKKLGYVFSNAQRTDIILAFMEEMKKEYPVGYYSNPDYLTYKLETERLKAWPLWLAQYRDVPQWECVLQQRSNDGKIEGIERQVDMDAAYRKYTSPEIPQKPERKYTVQKGDTLWDIAQKEKTTVEELLRLNPQIQIPSRIYPGDILRLPERKEEPEKPENKTVVVKAGDTLSEIALRHGLSLSEILRLNPEITNPSLIYPGQIIRVRE